MFFFFLPLIFVFVFPFILPFLALFIEIKDILITCAIIFALITWATIVLVRDGYGSKKKWKNVVAIIVPIVLLAVFAYLAATVEEQQVIDLIRKIPFLQKYM